MNLDLSPQHQALVDRMSSLAQESFAPRAACYDEDAVFPHENFTDLRETGLHAAVVPTTYGGLGLGPLNGSAYTLWMLTKQVAKADLSMARCWEGHNNALVLLDGLASSEQKKRWFPEVVEGGKIWVAWSGEPQARTPGVKARFGTTIEKVDGGYVVNGSKVFATSASGAQWAILLVNPAGPGGARHADAEAADQLLMLACSLADPSVTLDDSWWDPVGMRATVSYLVRFDQTFIPDTDAIGTPGQYLRDGWQTRFTPHYAASFLGAAEAAYEYALTYVRVQKRLDDPYVQHRLGRMSTDIETAHLWLQRVAWLWHEGRLDEAQLAGNRARYLVEHLAEDTLRSAIRVCGARCLNRPSPIERILRDLTFYLRHDNDDQILATIGRAVLGRDFDASFYKP